MDSKITDGGLGAGILPQSTPLPPCLPKLAYSEMNLGRVVGKGGFSIVSEVRSVDLNEDITDHSSSSDSRQQFASSARSKSYVLKTLRMDIPPHDLTKGIEDLAVEAKFLSVLSHPNIITMIASANTDPSLSRYFIVLERLDKTLDRQFNYWRGIVGNNSGYWIPCYGYCCSNTTLLHENWKERLHCAHDIASALEYLHRKKVMYRDLKPENIGFDMGSGALKLFDFGLAKSLEGVELSDDRQNYLLTGNTGSLRYMAPEVALDKPYNLSADAYSFAILFWQICSLTTPYAGYTQDSHSKYVVHKGIRPKPEKSWPGEWTKLMTQGWDQQPFNRPTLEQIRSALEGFMEILLELPIENRIRAKSKRRSPNPDNQILDVDTRIELTTANGVVKRHNANIV